MTHPLQWKKFPVLNDGFICLVDVMGNDAAIVQAARASYGINRDYAPGATLESKDRNLLRTLFRHRHTSPFEMVEIKFMVRVPMDCWRQWVRHRTANINEYSTRYKEAIDSQQTTSPQEWRLQATDNKQGSSGFLEEWPDNFKYEQLEEGNFRSDDDKGLLFHVNDMKTHPASHLSELEETFHQVARRIYEERLALGIAKEQARKDLPLSTYTEAYWKCDLHNIFNFLRLRMDSHAQYEIRMYANAMAEIVKQVVPVAWEAFEDYVLYAKRFSRMEIEQLKELIPRTQLETLKQTDWKPDSMTTREWRTFLEKLS